MIKEGRGGRIIRMSSLHATLSEPSAGPYTAVKLVNGAVVRTYGPKAQM